MKVINVLLADDNNRVLEEVNKLLSHTHNIRVIGQAKNGKEVIDVITDIEVDVIIMDTNMPIMDGITCASIIKKECPNIKIIMLTMYPYKSHTYEMLKIGAEGCVLKSRTEQELETAIHSVMSGKQYYGLIPDFELSTV
ncbi:MAG: response regulator transcription factor [Cyclobacteriaceae bacterium]|nr:response regulator transcription factor [Cyclobacteriaceae bacterium]